MVFVAEVVTLGVGVLMVVTNLKGRIQVTIHLLEVLFFLLKTMIIQYK